ncbi:AraC-type DNA-binding protein [Lishizhenia tianjinensis]|uniref:AraC-type DNA-binding protein n=1 Tax=Lishizhenia tianjinensis TaxID=477690 RepID=A0A1I6Y5G9_9FLAO|nr:helix-turn-helix transcriptional regulator [Lishizhenia tianjinensis]SFT45845.1 AraC-type DNA-binding protein [Lishizhenia tianjinensis]
MHTLPIYTIKEFKTKTSEFYVNDLSEHLHTHHFIHKPHKHDFYICVLFTKGRGRHEIDFKSYEVEPGSVFFLKPGSMHHWTFEEKAEGYIFFHSKSFYDLNYQNRQLHDFPFYFSLYNPPVIYLTPEDVKQTLPLLELLRKEENEDSYTAIKRASLIDLIYINFARLYSHQQGKQESKASYLLKLQAFEALVNQNYQLEKSPNFYAEKLNVSIKHLNRIVKDTLNITASQFIADRIILEAKKLLIHADYRVVEVADTLGYDDASYFIRFFKKHTGLTPNKFAG